MVHFPGQSIECLKCGQRRICGVVGHRAKDCTSNVLCSIFHLSGHTVSMRSASLTVETVDVPSYVKGSWAKVVARRKNRG